MSITIIIIIIRIMMMMIKDDKLAMNPTQFPTWITCFPCSNFSLRSPPGIWCQQQIRRRLWLRRPGLYLLERRRPACAGREGTAPLLLKRESDEGFWVRPAVWRSRFRSASGFIRSAPLFFFFFSFSPSFFFPLLLRSLRRSLMFLWQRLTQSLKRYDLSAPACC